MAPPLRKRGFLLPLAAEGVATAIPGCARSLRGAADSAERAINLFGPPLVQRWLDWLRSQPRALQLSALTELADLPAARSRQEAVAAIEQFAPDAGPEDRIVAGEYLAAVPRFVQRALVLDPIAGTPTLPHGQTPDNPRTLLNLLPIDVPPYAPHSPLPDTPFQLGDLLASSGFGIGYKATTPSQPRPVVLRFCLDPALAALLQQERDNLDRCIAINQGAWHAGLVRLLGCHLDYPTPFLVYEQVPGGDLPALLTNFRQQTGRGFAPEEVFKVVRHLAEALAFAHERGLVHGDLKPASVLVSGEAIALADLGPGAASARHALRHNRLSPAPAEQVGRGRGADTLLYLAPERRRGEAPDPRADLYSLGVVWYQLLVGDVTRELHTEWASELSAKFNVPAASLALIECCVGEHDRRPRDAGELLDLMGAEKARTPRHHTAPSAMTAEEVRLSRQRKQRLLAGLKELRAGHRELEKERKRSLPLALGALLLGALAFAGGEALLLLLGRESIWREIVVSWRLLAALGVLLGALLTLLVYLQRRRQQCKVRRADLVARADRVAEEYADEVQAWGGKQVLLNPDLLPEIIDAVEPETPDS